MTLLLPPSGEDHETVIEQLKELTTKLWDDLPPPKLTKLQKATPPSERCGSCTHPAGDHVSRGGKLLECPSRCPSCGDEAIARGLSESGKPAWVAVDWGKSGQEIDFCPFCGFDLRGTWKVGV